MDIHFFFEGAGSREEASSAFLATLLEQEPAFRAAFLDHGAEELRLGSEPKPRVAVEHRLGAGIIDVLLEYPTAVVLVENKISASAKRDGQLLEYYRGAVGRWPDKRIAAIYLAPNDDLGRSEVDDVRGEIDVNLRGDPSGDVANTLAWGTVQGLARESCRLDPSFAHDGMLAVVRAIDAAKARVHLQWSADDFLDAARAKTPAAGAVIGWILDWLMRTDPPVVMGNGKTGPLYLTVRNSVDERHKIGQIGLEGWVNISYDNLRHTAPFHDPALLLELIARLNAMPGMEARRIDDDFFEREGSSWIPPTILGRPEAMSAFLGTLDWVRAAIADR